MVLGALRLTLRGKMSLHGLVRSLRQPRLLKWRISLKGIIDESAIVAQLMASIDVDALLEDMNIGNIVEPYSEDIAEVALGVALQNEDDYVYQGNELVVAKETLTTKNRRRYFCRGTTTLVIGRCCR